MTLTLPNSPANRSSAKTVLAAVRRMLGPQRGPSRLLVMAALFWAVSAGFHLIVWAVDGGAWSGAVSWRKPIVFSASVGLLLWAVAWLLDRLPHRRRLAWSIAWVLVVSFVVENGLIIAQTWRGRASHFNTATTGDSVIFAIMGATVGVISLALVSVFVWSLIERPTNRVDRLAAFWGFALIMSGLGIGQWLVGLGNDLVAQSDQVPSPVTFGEAGVPKFPHAVAFHGVQLFMFVSAITGAAGVNVDRAVGTLRLTVAGYLGLMAYSLVQTTTGRAPGDVAPLSAALLAGGVAALSVAGLRVVASMRATAVGQ